MWLCKLLFITTPRTSKFLQVSIYSRQAEIRFMKSHKSMTHTTKYLQIQTAIKFCTRTEEEVKTELKCAWLIRNESWNYIVTKLVTISPPILQWQNYFNKIPIKSIIQLGLWEPGNINIIDTVLGKLKHNRIGYFFYSVGGEVLEQAVQRSYGCSLPPSVQGQVGCGSKQSSSLESVPAYGRGTGLVFFKVSPNPKHSMIPQVNNFEG